jgi:hypothetical protein
VIAERLTERIRTKVSGFKATFTDVARPALRECRKKMKVLPAK